MKIGTPSLVCTFDSGNPIHEYGLAVSPDGHYLLIGGTPDTPQRNTASVGIWSSERGVRISGLKSDGIFTACDWSPDNQTIVVVRLHKSKAEPRHFSQKATSVFSTELRFINATSMRTLTTITPTEFLVRCVQFDGTGKLLALGGRRSGEGQRGAENGRVIVLRLSDGNTILDVAHGDDVDAVTFVPKSSLLATDAGSSVGDDWGKESVRLWDLRSGRLSKELTRTRAEAPCRIAASPDGRLLAAGNGPEGDVLVWDTRTGNLVMTIRSDSDTVHAVAFSPDGTIIAAGARDTKVRLWSIAECKLQAMLAGHTAPVHSVTFAPDGKRLFSGETNISEGRVCIWNLDSRT